MPKKRQEARGGSSGSRGHSEEPKMDFKSILKDIEILTYEMETEEGLGDQEGSLSWWKASKEPETPSYVGRIRMKKQKEREEKSLQENEILRRFGGYNSSNTKRAADVRQPEDRVLRSAEGYFKNSVLDVKHLLQPSAPRVSDNNSRRASSKGKKKKGSKKGPGKRKGSSGRKRH